MAVLGLCCGFSLVKAIKGTTFWLMVHTGLLMQVASLGVKQDRAHRLCGLRLPGLRAGAPAVAHKQA